MPLLRANSTAVKRTGQRTILAFVVILGLAGFAILQTSANVMRQEIQDVNTADLSLLDEIYSHDGLTAVIELVEVASQRRLGAREIFGVFTLEGEFLAGDLTQEPDLTASDELFIVHTAGDSETAYLAQQKLYPDAVLYVGRPSRIIRSTTRNLMIILPIAFLIILALFLVFLRVASETMGNLLDRFETTLMAFSSGDRDARIPLGPHFDDRFHDVSQSINANLESAAMATQVLENTTVAIAHDLRTPLTRASLALQTAQTSGGLDEETEDRLHQASEEMGKLSQTFDTILRISNINAARGDANFSTFDLVEVLTEICETYAPDFEDEGFVLQDVVFHGPAQINADKRMVAQLVVNLLTNVKRHCPVGTVVHIKTDQRDGMVVLTIEDNGPGVPTDKLDWIFAPFSRVDESRSKSGTGLGLALVKAIATHNKATITARNLAPGLAFDVVFPAVDQG